MTDAITTERLVIRPFEVADEDVVMAGLNDFEIAKWLAPVPYPFTRNDLRLANDDGTSRWPSLGAICHKGEMIGTISGGQDFGYWLLRAFWGRGFATEAGEAVLGCTFRETDIDEVRSGYFSGNDASAKVLKKLGFTRTGEGMHHCRSQGKDLPHVDLHLTRANWEARQ